MSCRDKSTKDLSKLSFLKSCFNEFETAFFVEYNFFLFQV